jgi:hypothetical protein
MRELGRLTGLGVDWDASTRSVLVNTQNAQTAPEAEKEPEQENEPTSPTTPAPPATNTDRYEVITAAEAHTKYDNRENFVMVLFDSRRANTQAHLDTILGVARTANVKVYGVDVAAATSNTINPEFARIAVHSTNNVSTPIVFYVLGVNNVTFDPSPTNTAKLTSDFTRFRTNYRASTGGGGGGAFDIDFTAGGDMEKITFAQFEKKISDNDDFVLVYYSSLNEDSIFFMKETMEEAIKDSNRKVFFLDGAEIINTSGTRLQNSSHWLNNHSRLYDPTFGVFPIVYFIKDGGPSPAGFPEMPQPRNIRQLENQIRDFYRP